jgi:hypothetical protein
MIFTWLIILSIVNLVIRSANDLEKPLVIEPSLSFASYLGGSDYDVGVSIIVDNLKTV